MVNVMKVIAKPILVAFWTRHPRAEQPLKSWYQEALHASWKAPQNIKDSYASASFIAGNRVVFNIHGNDYRLVVGADYKRQALFIKFIGTHAEYGKIYVETV